MVSIPIKRTGLFALSLVIGFLFTEAILRYIVHYPVYGLAQKVYGIRGSSQKQNIWKSHSHFWNVEGNNRVFQRNNMGLPGPDIPISTSTKNIILLGSSFVEAMQFPQEETAAGLLNWDIKKLDPDYQVINLGCSGHDPYDSWRRLKYFENRFPPEAVIIIIEEDYRAWLQRQERPLKFEIPKNFGKPDLSTTTMINKFLRNNSTLLSLFAKALQDKDADNVEAPKTNVSKKKNTNHTKKTSKPLPKELLDCLQQFHKEYQDLFLIAIALDDAGQNAELKTWADAAGIRNVVSNQLMINENRINGTGHLNKNGNNELAKLLFGAITELHQK
jgi:hypothetical protein